MQCAIIFDHEDLLRWLGHSVEDLMVLKSMAPVENTTFYIKDYKDELTIGVFFEETCILIRGVRYPQIIIDDVFTQDHYETIMKMIEP